jgi:hypothetical protein
MVRYLIPAASARAALAAGGASGLAFIDLPALAITIGGRLGVAFLSYRSTCCSIRASCARALRQKTNPLTARGELNASPGSIDMHGSRALEGRSSGRRSISSRRGRRARDLDTPEEMRDAPRHAAEEIAGRLRTRTRFC